MKFVTLAEAARLTGRNASTITRSVNKGKVSCQTDENGQRVFDPSELERAFGLLRTSEKEGSGASADANAQVGTILHEEIKHLHEREIALMHEQVRIMHSQVEDLRKDRDHWRQQATYLLEDKKQTELEAKKVEPETKKKRWWFF